MYFNGIIATVLFFCVGSNVFSVAIAKSPLVCQGTEIKLPAKVEEVVKSCLGEQGAKTPADLAKDKKACYGKCLFTRNDVLGNNGIPNIDTMVDIMTTSFPIQIAFQYIGEVVKCTAKNAAKIMPFGEDCDSYKDISICVVDSFVKLCKGKPKLLPIPLELPGFGR